LATGFLRADIQSCKKIHFLGTGSRRKSGITSAVIEIQSSFYAHFKAKKLPLSVTYYTNIFSKAVNSRSSNLTFDLVFLKMRYFNFFSLNILRACNYYCICKYKVGTALGLGFVKQFTVKCHFICIDEATGLM
jgi:hypothetical protein